MKMNQVIVLALAALLAGGCLPSAPMAESGSVTVSPATPPEQSGDALRDQFESELKALSSAAFRAGVNAAVTAHLIWVKAEFEAGRRPSVAGMDIDQWHQCAVAAWNSNHPQAIIELPPTNP